jgi:hypothetical protein
MSEAKSNAYYLQIAQEAMSGNQPLSKCSHDERNEIAEALVQLIIFGEGLTKHVQYTPREVWDEMKRRIADQEPPYEEYRHYVATLQRYAPLKPRYSKRRSDGFIVNALGMAVGGAKTHRELLELRYHRAPSIPQVTRPDNGNLADNRRRPHY